MAFNKDTMEQAAQSSAKMAEFGSAAKSTSAVESNAQSKWASRMERASKAESTGRGV